MPGTRDFTAFMFTMSAESAITVDDLKKLARRSAKEYAVTEEGRNAYAGNCDNFNWGDLVTACDSPLFQDILRKNGLEIEWRGSTDAWIDQSEQLMEDLSVDVEKIVWDTNGVSIDDLPEEVTVDLKSPAEDVEAVLYDEYGYFPKSYSVKGVF